MTTLDRAFIKAYTPQSVAATMPAVEPVLAADAPEHLSKPTVVTSPVATKHSSVLAALEQPFRANMRTAASPMIVATKNNSPSTKSAEPTIQKKECEPAATQFELPAHDPKASDPSQPTLSAFLRLRDFVLPTSLDDAASVQPSNDSTLQYEPTSAIADSFAISASAQEGFGLSAATLRLDTAYTAAATSMPASPLPDEPLESQIPMTGSTLRPAWQVEQFTWPKICRRLISRATDELDQLADSLLAANQRGQKVLAISGWHRNEGATTLLLCAARRLAERGIKAVLVDADLDRPRLAKRLGVQPQASWNQATMGTQEVSLDQVMVEATVSNIALVPAYEPSAEGEPSSIDRSRLDGCIKTLRQHYDMVLVDLGPLENACFGTLGGGVFDGLDALVLVRDQRLTSQENLVGIQKQLMASGVAIAGVIENFVTV